MKRFFVLMVLCVAMTQGLAAQQQQDDVNYLIDKIKTLSSDEFGGRKPLSVHEQMTIDYIADGFREAGLQPANGDSFFQPVNLLSTKATPDGGKFVVKGKKGKVEFKYGDEYVMWTNRAAGRVDLKNLDYIFCGFGINAPEYGWNDYEGVDVKGKMVVVMVGDPGFYDESLFKGKNVTYYSRWTYKFEEGRRQGAAGVMIIHEPGAASYGWNVVRTSGTGIKLDVVDPNGNADDVAAKGWFTAESAQRLFKACGIDFDSTIAAAKKPGFKSFRMNAKSDVHLAVDYSVGESHNVVGILPGTDLKDEYVVYSGHWDHLGIGIPADGDSIYNGAADNASGTAALMLLAKKYAESPVKPRRSIIFAAVTAEEAGLLGSQEYCEHPLYPLEKTAVVINMDGVAPRERTTDITVRKYGVCPDVDRALEIVAAAQGKTIRKINTDPAGGYYRSDHFNFVKKGVPALLAGGGANFMDMVRHKAKVRVDTYHRPNDEYSDDWDFDGTLDIINMNFGVGLIISLMDNLPQWAPDAEFHR